MIIQIRSHKGHYDWAHPPEIQIMTYISIYEDEKIIKSVSLTTEIEYFANDNDPDEIADMIEKRLKKYSYCSDKENYESMIKFLRNNSLDLCIGNKEFELKVQENMLKMTELKINQLKNSINLLKKEKELENVKILSY